MGFVETHQKMAGNLMLEIHPFSHFHPEKHTGLPTDRLSWRTPKGWGGFVLEPTYPVPI